MDIHTQEFATAQVHNTTQHGAASTRGVHSSSALVYMAYTFSVSTLGTRTRVLADSSRSRSVDPTSLPVSSKRNFPHFRVKELPIILQ